VRHRPGKPNEEQERAFNSPNVVALVGELVAHPDLRLIKLADECSLIRFVLDADQIDALVGPVLRFDDDLGPVAQRVARLAIAIGQANTMSERIRGRGALLERLVHVLVESRLPGTTFHEHEIELMHSPRTHRSWTHKKEVVAEGRQFEIYECKTDALPDIGDIDQLSDVVSTGNAEGTDCRSTIVIFGHMVNLQSLARTWKLTEPIYGVTSDTVLALAKGPPSRRIVASQ
jgi:hypothetical protein